MPVIPINSIDTFLQDCTYIKPRPNIKQQWGPSCGLYALAEVINKKTGDGTGATIPARKHDIPGYTNPSLRQLAKERGMTDIGPMFNSFNLVKLAWSQGMDADLVHVNATNFKNKIELHINKNHMLLVPFDVSDSGDIAYQKGASAHWCIVFGYFTNDAAEHCVLANHWGKYYQWKTADLARSCDQLLEDPRGTYHKVKLEEKHRNLAVKHYDIHNKDNKPIKMWNLGAAPQGFEKNSVETLKTEKQELKKLRNRLVAIYAR